MSCTASYNKAVHRGFKNAEVSLNIHVGDDPNFKDLIKKGKYTFQKSKIHISH